MRKIWAGWGNGKGGKGVVGIVVRGKVVLWVRVRDEGNFKLLIITRNRL